MNRGGQTPGEHGFHGFLTKDALEKTAVDFADEAIALRNVMAIFAFVLPTKAQDETPKADLYAGYDYARVNDRGTSFNFNGGSGQLAYDANDWLGVVGDIQDLRTLRDSPRSSRILPDKIHGRCKQPAE